MDKGQQHGRFYPQQAVHEINANQVHAFAPAVAPNQPSLAAHNLQSMPQMAAAQQMQQSSVQQQQMGHGPRNYSMPQHQRHPRQPSPAMMQQRPNPNLIPHNPALNSQPGAMGMGTYPFPQYVVPSQMVQGIRQGIHGYHQAQYPPQFLYYGQAGAAHYIMPAQFSTAPPINQQTQSTVPVRTSAPMGVGTQNVGNYVQISQPTQPYIASTETPAQTTEPVNQFQPTPAVTRPPLEKRQRQGAIISDPTTGRVFTKQELQSKAPLEKPDTKADTSNPPSDASTQRNTPSAQSASSDAALEFRDKISSVALGAAGKEGAGENHSPDAAVTNEAEVDAESSTVTKSETTDSSEVVDGSRVAKPVTDSDKLDATDIDVSNDTESNVVAEAGVDKKTEISATNDIVAKIDDCATTLNSISISQESARTLPEVVTPAVPASSPSSADVVVEKAISDSVPVTNGTTATVVEEVKPTTTTTTSSTLPAVAAAVAASTAPVTSETNAVNAVVSVSVSECSETKPAGLINTREKKELSLKQLQQSSVKEQQQSLNLNMKSKNKKQAKKQRRKIEQQNTSQESKELKDVAAAASSVTTTAVPTGSVAVAADSESPEAASAKVNKTESSSSPETTTVTAETTTTTATATNDNELKVTSSSAAVTVAPAADDKTKTIVDNDECAVPVSSVSVQNSDGEMPAAAIKEKIDVVKVDFSSQLNKDELETRRENGKLEYGSHFLKSLQSAPESLRKPETLPKLDIVHDVPVPQREPTERGGYRGHSNAHQGMGPQDIFLPQYLHSAHRSQTRSASQRSNQNRPSQQDRPRKIISPSLTQDVKLHTVDNAWKPQAKSCDAPEEEVKTAELMKAFRGILNKLTPQKYMKLLEDVKNLTIDTEERLQGILELIFDKAVDEPAFCLQYANLCKHLASSLKAVNAGADENGAGKELRFTPLLLTRCQKEFESKMYEGIDVDGKQKLIDECADQEQRKLLLAELDEEKRKARKRSLGNIKLIGELYLLGMLKANIMMSCVERLLRDSEEESLECLCTLLRTIGSKLESDVKEFEMKKSLKRDSMLSPYFSALIDYVNEKKVSARVRFMIQDVLDMRQNGWKARKIQDENKPKTIDEIHSEAQEEEKKQMVQLQQHSQQKRQESMKKSGDWKNKNSKDVNMMLKNLKNTSTEHGTMQFGPGNFGGLWSQGARGGSQQKQQESQMSSNRPMTRPTIQQRDSQKGSGRNSDMGRKGDSGFGSQEGDQWIRKHSSGRNVPPFGQEVIVGNRTRDIRQDSRNSSMERGSAPSSRGGSMKRESQKPVAELSTEEIERRSMAAVNEYLGNNNTKDGIAEDIRSFCSDKNFHTFVTLAVNHALDVSSHQHQLSVGELLAHLYTQKLYNKEQFYAGLDYILQMADDIVVDVPKFFDYMGNILSPFYVNLDDTSRKQFFSTALKSCIANGCGAKLMCHVLKSACQSTPQNRVGSLWRSGGLSWSDFIAEKESERDFIERYELQFTVNPSVADGDNPRLKDSCNPIDREKFFSGITRKVQSSNTSNNNEELLELIEKSFETSEEKSDPNFVSALVKAVVYGCVNSSKVNGDTTTYSVDQKRLESKCAILAKYCDNDEERETKCLYALQELAEELEHPSKLLNTIFNTLHDQNVISSEAFLQWESADSSLPGKAVAVLSVRQFLTWLKEPEEFSDS